MEALRNKFSPAKKTKVFIGIVMIISITIATAFIVNFVLMKYDWINVHLIPHTHNDVGWLRTPEDYYRNYVKYILDHVILELQRNPSRKFIYVETYYFWKWWQEQSEAVQEDVKYLIREKQLEIVGGGWCMSDEAVTHYQSFIDQSTWGFRQLNDTFGPITCPTIAWQIDTFGHSKGIASLLAQMGFSSLFFARIDVNEKKYRKANKLMEFIWMGNKNLERGSSIFTSVFYDHYSAPKGFDFEMQPSQSNIEYVEFSKYVRKQANYYRTNNILVPMGDDFRYFNARKYFYKLDMLIRFFENNHDFKLNIFYSTPSLYISSLMNADLTWPEKEGDFFPYASELHSYWTGFFTSRPSLKYFERISNNFLQISKQLLVFSNMGMKFFDELTTLREAVGVLQHHDAITGTAQQHVSDHYAELLYEGIENCEKPVDEALGKLSVSSETFQKPIYKSCLLLNISSCDITEVSSRFVVTVYNPLSRTVNYYVRIPVTGKRYTVQTARGGELKTQMVAIPKSVRNIPGRVSTAKTELIFRAMNVPGMGFKSFYVLEEENIRSTRKYQKIFTRKNVKVIFDPNTELLSGVRTKTTNISVTQSMRYYKSTPHSSGAYLFKPAGDITLTPKKEVLTKLLNNGELVKEYEQTFSKWASQVIRIYKDEDYVEFEWLVGPIPVHDSVGKEVVLLYSSDIKSGNVFYTDVNGMEMQKRVKDYRSWREKVTESVAGNYYPVTTMISVRDDSNQIYVIVDRPQGGTSLRSGEVELMIHRRLCFDDGKGVDEPLNETAHGPGLVARGRHWFLFGQRQLQLDQKAKLLAQMWHSEPWLFFFDANSLSFEDWRSNYITEFSGLYTYVPRNIRILTLEPWREDTILLRLEHIFEKLPVFRLSNTPVLISLKNLFRDFDVLKARETTLGADRWLSDSISLKWKKEEIGIKHSTERDDLNLENNMTISLRPQEIRTFILTIKAKD